MWIAYEKSEGGKGVIAVAAGRDIQAVAKKNGLADGTWEEITDDEAAELMRPTAEDIRVARIAEIKTELAGIDAESVRPIRAMAEGTAEEADREKLSLLNERAEALRQELAAL